MIDGLMEDGASEERVKVRGAVNLPSLMLNTV